MPSGIFRVSVLMAIVSRSLQERLEQFQGLSNIEQRSGVITERRSHPFEFMASWKGIIGWCGKADFGQLDCGPGSAAGQGNVGIDHR